jgi:proteasome lid subunit RPN8/RPN11
MAAVERHAVEVQPRECCGILLGEPFRMGEVLRIRRVVPAENTRRDRPADRYSIHPRALLAAHQEARARRLEVLGYYHSHPAGRAWPSALDRRAAWPEVSYLILSLARGQVVDRRSWRLSGDSGAFEEEEIFVAPDDCRCAAAAGVER